MKHFLTSNDWSKEALESLIRTAGYLKQNPVNSDLSGKSIALLFLNPSLRTRTSFELGMQQHEVKSSQRQCWARLLPNVRV